MMSRGECSLSPWDSYSVRWAGMGVRLEGQKDDQPKQGSPARLSLGRYHHTRIINPSERNQIHTQARQTARLSPEDFLSFHRWTEQHASPPHAPCHACHVAAHMAPAGHAMWDGRTITCPPPLSRGEGTKNVRRASVCVCVCVCDCPDGVCTYRVRVGRNVAGSPPPFPLCPLREEVVAPTCGRTRTFWPPSPRKMR